MSSYLACVLSALHTYPCCRLAALHVLFIVTHSLHTAGCWYLVVGERRLRNVEYSVLGATFFSQ